MNITQRDVMILFVMSLAIVSMSFVFPVLGVTDMDTQASDIPDLDIGSDQFDFAGDAPRFPNAPNEGTLWLNTTKQKSFSDNEMWFRGNMNDGVQLVVTYDSVAQDAVVVFTRYNSTGVAEREILETANNSTGVLEVGSYKVAVETGDRHDPPDMLEINYAVDEGSESDGFLATIFGATDALTQVVGWLTSAVIWFVKVLVQYFVNAVLLMYDASVYFISIVGWLTSTYGSVISAAPGWTKVFVALPGILLSATLGKFVVVLISLIPTT